MTLQEFSKGIRFLLYSIGRDEYLSCINETDRKFIGDSLLWLRFEQDPVPTFLRLPTQDQERVFGLFARRIGGAS